MELPHGWLFIPKPINKGTAIEVEQKELIPCHECRFFELDHWEKPKEFGGVPMIVAHEICTRWGGGCKTDPDGYCFMAEPKLEGRIPEEKEEG